MADSDLRHFDLNMLRLLLQQQQENLASQVQTATFFGGEEFASLELKNQLRFIRRHIAELEAEIARREANYEPAPPPVPPASGLPNSAFLRRLLEGAFTADEFEFFCYDNYRSVHSQFVSTMSQTQRIHRLVQHVEGKSDLVQKLLAQVQDVNPAAFGVLMAPTA